MSTLFVDGQSVIWEDIVTKHISFKFIFKLVTIVLKMIIENALRELGMAFGSVAITFSINKLHFLGISKN